MAKKSAVSVISGADGPTSFITIGGKKKLTLPQRIQRKRFQIRKAWYEKHLPEEHHTMEEVCKYITDVYGFEEVSRYSGKYQEEYSQMRTSFLMQYAPELLGEYVKMPELKGTGETAVKSYFEQLERIRKAVGEVPSDSFDIDLHMFEKESGDMEMRLTIESKYGYIGGGASGKKNIRQFDHIYRDVCLYYGVTKEDIAQKTPRYRDLIRTLARSAPGRKRFMRQQKVYRKKGV